MRSHRHNMGQKLKGEKMSNLTRLNEILFDQLNELNDNSKSDDDIKRQIAVAKAAEGLASKVIQSAAVQLEAAKFKKDYAGTSVDMPPCLEHKNEQ